MGSVESPHVRPYVAFDLLRPESQIGQGCLDPAKQFHETASGLVTGMENERKSVGGDILVLSGEPLLDDVTEDGFHWLRMQVTEDAHHCPEAGHARYRVGTTLVAIGPPETTTR